MTYNPDYESKTDPAPPLRIEERPAYVLAWKEYRRLGRVEMWCRFLVWQ